MLSLVEIVYRDRCVLYDSPSVCLCNQLEEENEQRTLYNKATQGKARQGKARKGKERKGNGPYQALQQLGIQLANGFFAEASAKTLEAH